MPTRSTPVSRRYSLILGLTLVVGMVLAGALHTWILYRATVQQVAVALGLQGDLVQERVNSLLGSVEEQMQALAAMPWTAPNLTVDDRVLEFRRLIQLAPAILDLRLVTQQGTQVLLVSGTSPTDLHLLSFDRPGLLEQVRMTKGPVFGAVGREPGRVMPFVYLAVPDKGRSGLVTVARVSLKAVSESLAKLSATPGSVAYITEPAGEVLAHSTPTLALQPSSKTTVPAVTGVATVDRDGVPYVAYTRVLGKTAWHFHFEQRQDLLLAPVYAVVKTTLILVTASVVLALGVGRWLARRLADPLVQISQSAKRFAQGEFTHRAPPSRDRELNEVADSFNQMASELGTLTTDLQRRIDEKTVLLQLEFQDKEGKAREVAKLEERARIMRDLHDGLGSHLMGLLGAAKQGGPADGAVIGQMVQDALIEFRIAIDSLAPREPSLLAALANLRHRLAARLDATGIGFFWDLNQLTDALHIGPEKVFHLQRILLEAITNAVKHAKNVTRISVRAVWSESDSSLLLSIADDGDTRLLAQLPDLVSANGSRGLVNMRARAGLIGATVQVTPREPYGIEVLLTLPLENLTSPVSSSM